MKERGSEQHIASQRAFCKVCSCPPYDGEKEESLLPQIEVSPLQTLCGSIDTHTSDTPALQSQPRTVHAGKVRVMEYCCPVPTGCPCVRHRWERIASQQEDKLVKTERCIPLCRQRGQGGEPGPANLPAACQNLQKHEQEQSPTGLGGYGTILTPTQSDSWVQNLSLD